VLRSRFEDAAPVRDAALPFAAPSTSFNRSVSAKRCVAYASTPLESVATIRQAFGGTINDVVLAACTTALREYLLAGDELPQTPLVAAIPVSTRGLSDEPGGNHISAMLAELPVHIDEPSHRYWEVCRAAKRAKRFHSLLGKGTLGALAELTPGPLVGQALRLYSRWGLADLHRPLQNLIISNVPGPPVPLAFGGSSVRALRPHGPLMDGAGLNITVMSYAGSLDVGILACREAVSDPAFLARSVAASVEELAKRAEQELAGKEPIRLRVAS
jgi:WS/DGAT/MGAT family acyltransferase